jgi:hypothetical protein
MARIKITKSRVIGMKRKGQAVADGVKEKKWLINNAGSTASNEERGVGNRHWGTAPS